MFLPHLRKNYTLHYTCGRRVRDTGSILYASDILLLQLTQVTDHLKQRSWAARLLCKATKTDHIINLSQKHGSIGEAYCLQRLFLPAAFASNICYFSNERQIGVSHSLTRCQFFGREKKWKKGNMLLSLCFCLEMWRRYLDDRKGWGRWGRVVVVVVVVVVGGWVGWVGWLGVPAVEASTHQQLVFQVLMVLNTKRPLQIPTA